MAERDSQIKSICISGTSGIADWFFIPSGKLIVDDRDTESFFGELYYKNPTMELGGAIKIRDWVFALERMVESVRIVVAPHNRHNVWVIGGYHNNEHYSFDHVAHPDETTRNGILVTYIIKQFWYHLHPEVFDGVDKTKPYTLDWKLEKLDAVKNV